MEIFFGVVVVCSVVIATTAVDLPGLPPINATGQGSGGVRVDGPGPLDASGRIGGGGGLHVDDDDARLGGSGGGQVGLPPVPAIPVQVPGGIDAAARGRTNVDLQNIGKRRRRAIRRRF